MVLTSQHTTMIVNQMRAHRIKLIHRTSRNSKLKLRVKSEDKRKARSRYSKTTESLKHTTGMGQRMHGKRLEKLWTPQLKEVVVRAMGFQWLRQSSIREISCSQQVSMTTFLMLILEMVCTENYLLTMDQIFKKLLVNSLHVRI